MVECYLMCQSDNGSITEEHALRQWSNKYIRSLDGLKDPRAPLRLQALFTTAGLVNVEMRMIPLPLCAWANGMEPGGTRSRACAVPRTPYPSSWIYID